MPTPTRAALAGLVAAAALAVAPPAAAVDDVFIYSSESQIRGLNLTLGTDSLLTVSPLAGSANALAVNDEAGFVYYGDGTSVYRWDPAIGTGPAAHSRMMDFAAGPVTAPITALDSTGGSFLDGSYYVGSEDGAGNANELWELDLSLDGTQVVSATALDLLGACGCTAADIGGFGDIAATREGGTPVIYGSTSGLGAASSRGGRWRFVPSTGAFEFLATAANGQLANSLSGALYSNVGEQVREVDRATGATSGTTLFTTSAPIYDFTSGFALDFGDAPAGYGGAFHRVDDLPGGARIGALGPDNDPGTLNAAAGAADGSGDDVAGIDDEDAVAVAPPVEIAAGRYSLEVDCSAGTRVAGWIDLDLNRRFDARERNDNHPASCIGGRARLEWDALPRANGGESWMRLRASSNVASISVPVGIASDGEVEDHPVRIDGPSTISGNCPGGSVSSVYEATDLPLAVPAGAANEVVTRVSTISVPPGDDVVDVNVLNLAGTHTWISDLRFFLVRDDLDDSPDLDEFSLLYGYSCTSEDDFAFSFDDEAATAPTACPPTTGGLHRPVQALDAFDGAPSGGDWDLYVQNRSTQQRLGTVRSWSIELCTAAPTVEAPELRLGKAASVDGRDVTVTLALENVGDSALGDVELEDDLDVAFGAGNYTVTVAPTLVSGPATVAPDPAYTGSGTGSSVLLPGASLDPGERATVRFTVRIDALSAGPDGALGDYVNSASASGTTPGGATATDASNAGLDLTVDDDVPTPILVDVSARLSGRVFVDVSGAAASHDGIDQPGESGDGGRVVELLAADGTSLGSTRTDGEGNWSFSVPSGAADAPVTVRVRDAATSAFVSEAPGFADADVTDGTIVLTPGTGASVDGIDVGVVPAPRLETDRIESAVPGARVGFAHVYVASSHGRLEVALGSDTGTGGAGGTAGAGAGPGLDARIVVDADCDGAVGPGEREFAGPAATVPGQTICLVVDAFVPTNALPGTRLAVALDTLLTLDDASGTGHGTTFERRNVDTVNVAAAGGGRLTLDKRVRNVTLDEPFGESNAGLPGHVLEYEIRYRNVGAAPIEGLEVDDLAPAYTAVEPGSATCTDTPAPLACSVIAADDSLGWRFTGALPAGAGGTVGYRVTVD